MPKDHDDEQADDVGEMARELMSHLEVLATRFLLTQKELSRSETSVLRFLAGHGAASMTDVAAGVNLALSSATGIVDRLVERKLVERERPEEDRRTVMVELTQKGRKMHQAFVQDRIALGMGMLEPLAPAERRKLLSFFRKMTTP